MPFTVTMPKLSPTMTEGAIAKWHKKANDHVKSGELLLEVATDKATVEYNALDEGYLRKVMVKEGETAQVNQPIAIFTEEKTESIEGYQPEGEVPSVKEEKEQKSTEETQDKGAKGKPEEKKPAPKAMGGLDLPNFSPEPPLEKIEFPFRRGEGANYPLASPLAKKIAKEKGLNLSKVKGSGPRGRIMERDLDRAESEAVSLFSNETEPTEKPGSYEETPLTPMRKTIGKRLQQAKTFIPHFYTYQEIDAEPLVAIREQLKNMGVSLTYNDFIVRACALALRKHPAVNRGLNTANQTLVQYKTVDISIAVSIADGLITPIIRYADYKTLGEISSEVKALVKRAKEGQLSPEEYKGGSFTISNLGMTGITSFLAIINPPQSAILSIGGIEEKPVVKQGAVVPGKVMNIALSADHRVIDGMEGAQFLKTVQKLLQNPSALLVS